MVKWDLAGRCVRRWYIVLLGLALTAILAANIGLLPGVYWARTQVLLLGPPSDSRPNKLDSNSAGLIATAGLIEREMNIGRLRLPATSIDVTLLDQGIYDGEQVRLPNKGGQWANNFDQAVLDVQASGPSRAVVQQRIEGMLEEIERILQRRQDAAAVSRANRITVALSPPEIRVHYVRGDRKRAVAVATSLGLSLTVMFVGLIDRRLVARRTRSKPQRRPAPMKKKVPA
jgi:hypothetical protein